MLWTIFVVLGILWLLGFSFHVGGGLIHLLLLVALVILVVNVVSRRRSAVWKPIWQKTILCDSPIFAEKQN